jgi:hypothetical protein
MHKLVASIGNSGQNPAAVPEIPDKTSLMTKPRSGRRQEKTNEQTQIILCDGTISERAGGRCAECGTSEIGH